jgi:hypothetical protein
MSSGAATVGPLGPRSVSCAEGYALDAPSVSSTDVVVGPLRFPDLREAFLKNAALTAPNYHGRYFYKTGPQVQAGATVTVAVSPSASSFASLVSAFSPDGGDQAITYHSCSNTKYGTWWVGGFLLRDRSSACVPLLVTVAGESQVRRITVAIRVKRCTSAEPNGR